ncbi:hypothetical protein [Streptomyces sp. NPDC002537]
MSRNTVLDELNEEIRTFLAVRRGRALTVAERRVYERLRSEWLAAGRRARYGTAGCSGRIRSSV